MSNHKYCVVSTCSNTLSNYSEFFTFPKNNKKRALWLNKIGFEANKFSPKTHLHICSRHFDLKNDLKDYNKYCNRTGRYSFKEHIVPHLNLSLSDDVSATEIQLSGENYETELCAR
ncbi:uncharacterized protein LOC116922287 isoform X2 [Daphnia magna]|uniref:uncharacterized protein LOC116922287 isoform X2 n=1 Tax=Daphnia magna TaxID=35525 RepID=UPI001403F210|nr:uncharacterized protein LOC116922287 isoform X2 [Daphnia magna]